MWLTKIKTPAGSPVVILVRHIETGIEYQCIPRGENIWVVSRVDDNRTSVHELPYRGSLDQVTAYARRCITDVLRRASNAARRPRAH